MNDTKQTPIAKAGLTRREFLKAGAAAGLAAMTAAAPFSHAALAQGEAKPKGRPNVLIIISDQLNIDAISVFREHYKEAAWGPHWVKTPNLDRLVGRGVAFLESHSANPVCCPARAAIFTGRMAIETGVVYNNIGIDDKVPNMAQWFEQHGDYDRAYCGKWHAGGQWNCPDVDGPRKIPGFDTIPVMDFGVGATLDYQVSANAEAYIRNHRGEKPFLLVASLLNPHDICMWTGSLMGRLVTARADEFGLGDRLPILPPNHSYSFSSEDPSGKPVTGFDDAQWRNYAYDYYRMVEKVDADVGRMLEAVEARGGDTLVIFTADHGEGLGRHGRVQKWHPYDESVRVPLIIAWPGHVKEGVIDDAHLVSGVDIMPTVCDYAGIPAPPHARGFSLRPLLDRDGAAPAGWRDHVYAEMQHVGRMIRTAQYKFVKFYKFSGKGDAPFVKKSDGTATQFEPGHGADYEENPVRLLFDMKADPWETKNLAGEPQMASVLTSHEALLREWEAKLIPGTHYDRN
ncbi:MAG: sulfatase-like hydrolase/transferase [bacterium]|nr:sulfatase-like hydrolase/transferase [bacterium]